MNSGFLKFPDNFLWGAGTSARQVEGHNRLVSMGNKKLQKISFRGKIEVLLQRGAKIYETNLYH